MFTPMRQALTAAAVSGLLLTSTAVSADGNTSYQVTITNITSSINFTPILVTSHRKGVSLYELGSAASDELTAIAEGGDIAPLSAVLQDDPRVADIRDSGGLLGPGESVTVTVSATHGAHNISMASMMLPTNDGFIALNSVKAPIIHRDMMQAPNRMTSYVSAFPGLPVVVKDRHQAQVVRATCILTEAFMASETCHPMCMTGATR